MKPLRLRHLIALLFALSLLVSTLPTAFAKTLAAGDEITLGHYFQDTGWDDPIQWRVLDARSDKALVIAVMLLDSQPYDTAYGKVTWQDSTVRYWLNHDFLDTAFTADEQERILTTNVIGESSQVSEDQLFLLSKDEVIKYFGDGRPTRMAYLTPYAMSSGTWESKSGTGWWWLRTTAGKRRAMWVNVSGGIQTAGTEMGHPGCIRPAMWVTLP